MVRFVVLLANYHNCFDIACALHLTCDLQEFPKPSLLASLLADARTCAWYYIRHGTFVVDFVATIPFVVQVAVACTGYSGHLLRIVYTLRLLRLLRVARLLVDLSPGSIGGPMRVGAIQRSMGVLALPCTTDRLHHHCPFLHLSLQPIVSLLSPRMVLLFTSFFSLAVLVNLLGCLWWNMALDEGRSRAGLHADAVVSQQAEFSSTEVLARSVKMWWFVLNHVQGWRIRGRHSSVSGAACWPTSCSGHARHACSCATCLRACATCLLRRREQGLRFAGCIRPQSLDSVVLFCADNARDYR